MAANTPLVVITGPTASGKTSLALDLAERYGGEIICADSRTIYKGMDIGTAKPTALEQARVPHHLLDVVEPNEVFTAHDFQVRAMSVIEAIRGRGRIPFLVGGTGLYIDSVVLEYQFPVQPSAAERARLERLSREELLARIDARHLPRPRNLLNKRHLISTLLRDGARATRKNYPSKNTIVVAIATEQDELERRIILRAKTMFESGVLLEAQRLGALYGWDSEAMTGNIYPILHEVLYGRLSRQEAIQRFVVRDRQLAKRQVTWLKRHEFVQWLSLDDARRYLEREIGRRVRLDDVLG